jgi:hypothetical protein
MHNPPASSTSNLKWRFLRQVKIESFARPLIKFNKLLTIHLYLQNLQTNTGGTLVLVLPVATHRTCLRIERRRITN